MHGDAPIDRARIAALIPHQGDMCLWDEVLAWDAQTIRLRAMRHRDPAHPLRSGGRLRAVHLCEYGAQAMAVHGGLLAAAGGGCAAPGVLVALRGVQLRRARIDDLPGDLVCEARQLVASAASQQYGFRITHAGELLAEGRAAVVLQPQADVP
ncbi:phosphotransferase [Lysobacter arseniciresistens ZS79]|uniref:Phosphotransferase n=1 Tax=Lysobacter arseniciresistens ZS79 TaxID=913325 RepID=A0A0A0EWN8_9GAMM|nr:phosphotransferase [Lysobacter arseniciresistens ZS79]